MSGCNTNSNFFDKFNSWAKRNHHWADLSKISISLSIVIYLSCIVTGIIDQNKKRLEPTELGMAVVVLLINSDFIERLQKMRLSKDGVDFTLESKVHSNFKVSQKEAHALTYLGEVLFTEKKYNQSQKQFFDILLNDGDRDVLENFYKEEKLCYDKSDESFDNLLHLISLGFLDNKPEYKLIRCLIDEIPEKGNIKEYYCLTNQGKTCLALGSSSTIKSPENDATGVHFLTPEMRAIAGSDLRKMSEIIPK